MTVAGGGNFKRQKNPYRPSPAPSSVGSYYSSGDDAEAQRRKCRPRCTKCCAWTSLAIGAAALFALACSLVFYSFLVANVPRVFVKNLEVHSVTVGKDEKGDATLAADVTVVLNVTNANGKIWFEYGPMTADVALDGVRIGRSEVAAFRQEARNTTAVAVRSRVEALEIEEADGDDLVSNSARRVLTLDVWLSGLVEYHVRERVVSGCPFKVMCQHAPQSVLDSGLGFECNVRMSPL
ncbi:unnamed protein product [Cuscuta campestris]|uniref:Uncharacterized protein n=1 Tax=Cuscuta campestris TaxID=132261 RepID=A0A484NJZ4_9ASTE|nr:unnamed protein product [Cuscuta campestris]